MLLRHRHRLSVRSHVALRTLILLLACGLLPALLAATPGWWIEQSAIDTHSAPDDFAAANIGQVKHMASRAYLELNDKLPGGAGAAASNMVWSWSQPSTNRDDYAAINLGQLKTIARPFYDRLIANGLATNYPWVGSPSPRDDYAIANIGQVKYVFAWQIPENFGSPGNVAAELDELGNVELTWTAALGSVESYSIEQSQDGGLTWIVVGSVSSTITSFEVTSLPIGPTYIFRIRAANGALVAPVSASKEVATVAPSAPTGVSVEPAGPGTIIVNWTDASDNESNYLIERSTDSGTTWATAATLAANATSYADTTATSVVDYLYRVTAINNINLTEGGGGTSTTVSTNTSKPKPARRFMVVDLGIGAARRISKSGKVAGTSDADSFYWENGTRTNIPNFTMKDMNNNGLIAGFVPAVPFFPRYSVKGAPAQNLSTNIVTIDGQPVHDVAGQPEVVGDDGAVYGANFYYGACMWSSVAADPIIPHALVSPEGWPSEVQDVNASGTVLWCDYWNQYLNATHVYDLDGHPGPDFLEALNDDGVAIGGEDLIPGTYGVGFAFWYDGTEHALTGSIYRAIRINNRKTNGVPDYQIINYSGIWEKRDASGATAAEYNYYSLDDLIYEESLDAWEDGYIYDINDSGVCVGSATNVEDGLAHAIMLLPLEFVGMKLDASGNGLKTGPPNAQSFTWDRATGGLPGSTDVLRLNEYADWHNRQDLYKANIASSGTVESGIHTGASTRDENYGIYGMLRDDIPALKDKKATKNQPDVENKAIAPYINMDHLLFKVRLPKEVSGNAQHVTVVPITIDAENQEHAGDAIILPWAPESSGSLVYITTDPILLYSDPSSALNSSRLLATGQLPANTHLIKADRLKVLSEPAGGQPGTLAMVQTQRQQIYLAADSDSLLEHDPAAPWPSGTGPSTITETANAVVTGELAAGSAVRSPSNADHRFFAWIDESDESPDLRLDLKRPDGTAITPKPGSHVEWFLLYRFKGGSWGNLHGVKFDVWQWHKLLQDSDGLGVTLRERNEIWRDRIADSEHRFRQGGLQPGDYQIFARYIAGGNIVESNLIEFKIIAMNPGNSGRPVAHDVTAGGQTTHITGAQAVVSVMPASVIQLIDDLPNAEFGRLFDKLHPNADLETRAIPDFKLWYKGMVCQESGWTSSDYRQNFDQTERVPEEDGRDIGYMRKQILGGVHQQWPVRFGFPICSPDNGWGLSQQTGEDNRLIEIGRWKANVLQGWFELTNTKVNEARGYIINGLYPGTPIANIPSDVICKEIVTRYNGLGRPPTPYYARHGSVVEVNPASNVKYIINVLPYKTLFDH